MKLFIYAAIALLIAPCNASKKAGKKSDNYSKTQIIYQRTACFGTCPVYTLTIDGATEKAIYKGEQNTEKLGVYFKHITQDEIKTFVDAFEKAGFNSLDDEYLGMITDFPIKYITFSHRGKIKKIKDRSGAPQSLTELEKMLEAFADGDGWAKE